MGFFSVFFSLHYIHYFVSLSLWSVIGLLFLTSSWLSPLPLLYASLSLYFHSCQWIMIRPYLSKILTMTLQYMYVLPSYMMFFLLNFSSSFLSTILSFFLFLYFFLSFIDLYLFLQLTFLSFSSFFYFQISHIKVDSCKGSCAMEAWREMLALSQMYAMIIFHVVDSW